MRRVLWDVSSDVGIRSAVTLAEFGENGVKMLKNAMLQAQEERAEQALRCIAHGLAEIGDMSGIDYLISALHDESWYEWSTPWVLAKLKDPQAEDALLDYLRKNLLERQAPSGHKVRITIKAIAKVDDERIIPLAKEAVTIQRDRKILKEIFKLLGTRARQLKERVSIQILIDLLKNNDRVISRWARDELVKAGGEWITEIERSLQSIEEDSKQHKLLKSVISQLNAEKTM